MSEEMVFFEKGNDIFDNAFFAIQANNYIPYSGIDLFEENIINVPSPSVMLESTLPSPEDLTIQNDIISRLSNDAKFILHVLFNPPNQLRCPKSQNITKRSLKMFLIKQKWNPLKINKVFMEMKNYVANNI
jgi:hypothetical protein